MSQSEIGSEDVNDNISLIDLSQQLPFNIDDDLKEKLSFSEALVISCCHGDDGGSFPSDTASTWTCTDSKSTSQTSEEEKKSSTVEPSVQSESEDEGEPELEDDNFQFFFFSKTCELPPEFDKDASVVLEDGIPALNPYKKSGVCICKSNDEIDLKCTCALKVCECGPEVTIDCKCEEAVNPCVCYPDTIHPVCICDKMDKVCVCKSGVIQPICVCSSKPSTPTDPLANVCKCKKDEKLLGEENLQKLHSTCSCVQSNDQDDQVEQLEDQGDELVKDEEEEEEPSEPPKVCTCPPEKRKKRVEGYVVCNDTDPQHTYFDYGFDKNHEKIKPKPAKPPPKLEICGLHDKKPEHVSSSGPVNDTTTNYYRKVQKKYGVDCCSSVGGASISVQTLGECNDRFLVQVFANFSKNGANSGIKIVSIIDCNLHTLEESRTEYVTKGKNNKERRSYMAICNNGYYNKVTRICNDKKVSQRIQHTFDDAHDFILEGANIVLLRYMAITRFRGNLETTSVLICGSKVKNNYISYGVSNAIVNGTPMYVVKVDRIITEECGLSTESRIVMTLKGYLVSHEWAQNNIVMHINPLLRVDGVTDEIEQHAPSRLTWRQDMQLLSDYLDFKSTRTAENARYMAESAELDEAVRDYLQALLLLRPSDAISFTRHYFGAVLSSLDLPHNDFFNPASRCVRYYYFED